MSCDSRRGSSRFRATRPSWWRRVSTTSIASISSSSFCGGVGAGAGGPTAVAEAASAIAASAIDRQGPSFRHEAGDAALALLHRVADLGRVLRGESAHLVDDFERALLE